MRFENGFVSKASILQCHDKSWKSNNCYSCSTFFLFFVISFQNAKHWILIDLTFQHDMPWWAFIIFEIIEWWKLWRSISSISYKKNRTLKDILLVTFRSLTCFSFFYLISDENMRNLKRARCFTPLAKPIQNCDVMVFVLNKDPSKLF